MKIAYGESKDWHSYTYTANHPMLAAKNIEGLIDQLFNRLAVVHGSILFYKGIAYLTAAKDGLSRQELEDVLSCDEDVLDDVFQWWVPPIRRLPPLQVRPCSNLLNISRYRSLPIQRWAATTVAYIGRASNRDTS